MYNIRLYVLLIITITLCKLFLIDAAIPFKSEHESKGVLLLDGITYSKIVPNVERDVVILICNKGDIGQYGTDSIRADYFSMVSKLEQIEDGNTAHVIFAQLIVNGGENKRLAVSIGVDEDFVYPKLFVIPSKSTLAIPYPDDQPFQMSYITRFIAKHASFLYQMPGTLKSFDDLAAKFMASTDDGNVIRTEAYEQCQELYDNLEAAEGGGGTDEVGERAAAKQYLKIMSKILKDGIEYLDKEIQRQNRLLNDTKSKLTNASRRHIEHRLNILHHFLAHKKFAPFSKKLTDKDDNNNAEL